MNDRQIKPCNKCGVLPILKTSLQVWTHDRMYYYICPVCGYWTGYGVTGRRLTGKTVTDEEAINIAAQKWERGETVEANRKQICDMVKGAAERGLSK